LRRCPDIHFHIQLIDDPATPEKRPESREAHWAYFGENRDHFIGTLPDGEMMFHSDTPYTEHPLKATW
jgi:hypothetical protein